MLKFTSPLRRAVVAVLLAVAVMRPANGAEFNHPAAAVQVPGAWEKDKESAEDELTLNSKPEGQQIIVSLLRLKKEPADMGQAADLIAKMFKIRLEAFVALSNGTAKIDKPETEITETRAICLCRLFAEKGRIRLAIRIEASPTTKIVRTTSVYDYSGKSADEFLQWSDAVLAGVK